MKLGLSAERLDVAEHREELPHRDRQELRDTLASKLTNGPTGGLVARHLAEQNGHADDVIDGHAVDVPS